MPNEQSDFPLLKRWPRYITVLLD